MHDDIMYNHDFHLAWTFFSFAGIEETTSEFVRYHLSRTAAKQESRDSLRQQPARNRPVVRPTARN